MNKKEAKLQCQMEIGKVLSDYLVISNFILVCGCSISGFADDDYATDIASLAKGDVRLLLNDAALKFLEECRKNDG